MKKQILNIGKALNKAEQKSIFGGTSTVCESDFYNGGPDCPCDCYYDPMVDLCFMTHFPSPGC